MPTKLYDASATVPVTGSVRPETSTGAVAIACFSFIIVRGPLTSIFDGSTLTRPTA